MKGNERKLATIPGPLGPPPIVTNDLTELGCRSREKLEYVTEWETFPGATK